MTQGTITESLRKYIFLAVSLLFYLLACASPCLEVSKKGDEVWFGLRILVIGWLGPLVGQFSWLANPLWAGGLLFFTFRRWKISLVLTGLSLVFALQTLLIFGREFPGDEGNVTKFEFVRLRYGFYLWLISLLVMLAGNLMMRNPSRKFQSCQS